MIDKNTGQTLYKPLQGFFNFVGNIEWPNFSKKAFQHHSPISGLKKSYLLARKSIDLSYLILFGSLKLRNIGPRWVLEWYYDPTLTF